MKIGMDHMGQITEEKLIFLRQLGVEGIMGELHDLDPDRGFFEFTDLLRLKTWIEGNGMQLGSLSGNLQWHWNYKWMLGLPGRDEQIENCQRTLRNMGAIGIPVFTYNIHAMRFYRTSSHAPVRGNARGTSFDADLVKDAPLFTSGRGNVAHLIPESHRRPIGDDEMWENLRYFLEAVIPVAEEAGVKMALHPDDPQVPEIGGVARIMRTPEAFRRVIEMVPSENNGLLFCVGCFTEMGADVPEEIRYFGSRGRLFWIHFRNTTGTVENFHENFPDEGQTDMHAVMKACHEVGCEGYLTPDHRIRLEGDTEWGHRYWAYALGFNRALMMAVRAG